MSDIIFPAGFIVDYPSLDIEMMQHYGTLWNVEHTLLGQGLFEGSLWGVHTPHIQIGISHFSQEIMSKGDFPDGCVLLHYSVNEMTNASSLYNFHNRPVLPHEVLILTKGNAYDRVTYGSSDINTIAIKKDLFYKEFYAFFGDTPDASIQKKRFYLKQDKVLFFQQTIISWISYLVNEFPKLTVKPDYDTMESEILRQLFSCIMPAPLLKKREKFQTKKVRDLLQENIDQHIDISFMTNELDISESQLHQAFKKEYGVTPKKYLRLLRFNAIKKELLSADPDSITIANIAYKYNFFQMGHFSTQYKKMFRETPSQTLHK